MTDEKSSGVYCVTHIPVDPVSPGMQVLQVSDAPDSFTSLRDNTGDNIAVHNPGFSELTAYYWVWKNKPTDTVGFCHYRRALIPESLSGWLADNADRPYKDRPPGGLGSYASGYLVEPLELSSKLDGLDYSGELIDSLTGYDILLPRQNRVMEGGMIRQYGRAHPIEPFYAMLAAIARVDNNMGKEALQFFTEYEYAHWNNLFFTGWDIFDEYCEFQFEILLSLNTDDRQFANVYQNRFCAFLSERLFNFWVWHKKLKVKQLDWCMTERLEDSAQTHQRLTQKKAVGT